FSLVKLNLFLIIASFLINDCFFLVWNISGYLELKKVYIFILINEETNFYLLDYINLGKLDILTDGGPFFQFLTQSTWDHGLWLQDALDYRNICLFHVKAHFILGKIKFSFLFTTYILHVVL
ncbi:hypothetical protein ACJX0J_040922, partial [Zea mays]